MRHSHGIQPNNRRIIAQLFCIKTDTNAAYRPQALDFCTPIIAPHVQGLNGAVFFTIEKRLAGRDLVHALFF
jgi:hypothetical protein